MAYGNRFPAEFNPWRVPDGAIQMAPGQHAADPFNKMDRQFLVNRFIVGGALNTIPSTRTIISTKMNLKRCGMCQVLSNRI